MCKYILSIYILLLVGCASSPARDECFHDQYDSSEWKMVDLLRQEDLHFRKLIRENKFYAENGISEDKINAEYWFRSDEDFILCQTQIERDPMLWSVRKENNEYSSSIFLWVYVH